jgi:hypothetical protein
MMLLTDAQYIRRTVVAAVVLFRALYISQFMYAYKLNESIAQHLLSSGQ